nr:hypothetical protein [Yersinia bercovieri]
MLVPVVYLAGVKPGDLQANGALIAANNIELTDMQGLTNQGVIKATNNLQISMAKDITLTSNGGLFKADWGSYNTYIGRVSTDFSSNYFGVDGAVDSRYDSSSTYVSGHIKADYKKAITPKVTGYPCECPDNPCGQ